MGSAHVTPDRENAALSGPIAPELKSALDAFETTVATPMVPGEHDAWTSAVVQAWQNAEPAFKRHLAQHEHQYKEMLAADREIFKRVELLRREDQGIADDLHTVGECIARLRLKAPVAEPNEARTDKERQAVVDGGIALVVRIKKQEVAIGTWYVEAFHRDRGAVD